MTLPVRSVKIASNATAKAPLVASAPTTDIDKIYAESFHGHAHLRQVQMEAQKIGTDALSA